MQSNKKILLLCVLAPLLLFLTACVIGKGKELEYPLNGGIPQSEIVFMPDAGPVYVKQETKTLGFVNASGSNRQEYTFTLFGGSVSMFNVRYATLHAFSPRWSMSGNELAFSIPDPIQNMRLIGEDGKMYGRTCTDISGSALTFDLQGNVFAEITKHALVYEDYKDMTDSALIARYDLKSCQIVAVFSLPVPFGSFVGEISESDQGVLSAAFYDFDTHLDSILLYDETTGEYQTFPGFHPSLTEDGALLAYYSMAGALVIRDMRTGMERELLHFFPANDDWPPRFMSMPGWSPDHQWLVYNTPEGEIFKINIETGENIYLTYGWVPDWR